MEYIAIQKAIPIYKAFQGTIISEKLTILSPTKDLFLELLFESDKMSFRRKFIITAYN